MGGEVTRPAADLGAQQVRPATASSTAHRRRTTRTARVTIRPRFGGQVVDPGPGLDPSDPVDEQHGLRAQGRAGSRAAATHPRAARRRRRPTAWPTRSVVISDAGAVRRVPAVDVEPHPGRPDPSRIAGRSRLLPFHPGRPVVAGHGEPHRDPVGERGDVGDDPTIRSPFARFSSVSATTSRLASSRVPKPSSRKIESSRAAPVAAIVDSCELKRQRESEAGLEGLAAGQGADAAFGCRRRRGR